MIECDRSFAALNKPPARPNGACRADKDKQANLGSIPMVDPDRRVDTIAGGQERHVNALARRRRYGAQKKRLSPHR